MLKVNSEYYCSSLINSRIFLNLFSNFGTNWVWQEDKAPPHRSHFTQSVLARCVPSKVIWPPRYTDLSPIEHVCGYMKKQITGFKFNSQEELFYCLRHIWNSIPKAIIHNFYSSFLARCVVCNEINGE